MYYPHHTCMYIQPNTMKLTSLTIFFLDSVLAKKALVIFLSFKNLLFSFIISVLCASCGSAQTHNHTVQCISNTSILHRIYMYLLPESVSSVLSLPFPKPSPGRTALRGLLGGFILKRREDCVSVPVSA